MTKLKLSQEPFTMHKPAFIDLLIKNTLKILRKSTSKQVFPEDEFTPNEKINKLKNLQHFSSLETKTYLYEH